MPRVLHIVVTDAFAGVERYVSEVASETAKRGWEVAVVGGSANGMRPALDDKVRWEPGGTLVESLRSVSRLGRWDVCHVQMTAAEAVAVATRRIHRAPIVTTRQFAARRGSSLVGRIGAPWIASGIAREIAVSEFIARNLERPPAAVILSGVSQPPCLWRDTNRNVACAAAVGARERHANRPCCLAVVPARRRRMVHAHCRRGIGETHARSLGGSARDPWRHVHRLDSRSGDGVAGCRHSVCLGACRAARALRSRGDGGRRASGSHRVWGTSRDRRTCARRAALPARRRCGGSGRPPITRIGLDTGAHLRGGTARCCGSLYGRKPCRSPAGSI